ncbi:MAG: hypothetical protein NTZ16_05150 [Verrucomicrobia bacterium]|nr:hypothetical protein [Verrucomicrobiota bacterium]
MAEKSVNDIAHDLKALFRKGNEALQRDNFDYAIALYNQILDKEPACYECRESLRAAQAGKAGKAGGFFKKAFNFAGASPQLTKARLAVHRNPLEAIATAEQILNGDPHNFTAHKILADAALAAEMPRTAVLSLEAVVRNAPGDKAATAQLADALSQAGDVNRAERLLGELCRAFPADGELSKQLKNVAALRTMGENGYETLATGTGSYRDILRDKDEAVSLEQEKRVEKTEDVAARLIGEYETRLQTEPNNLKLIRDLAELYTQKEQFDRALEYYDRIKKSEGGNDSSLDRNIALTVVRKCDHQIAHLDPAAPDHAATVARLEAEKLAYQLAECQQRVERFPTDLVIRFEFAQLLFKAGKIGEAIQELQKAQNNPHKRIAAMSLLAQCFATRKMFDLAARTLQNALKEKTGFDDERKELVYQLGCVLEKMGKKDEAMEQFKLIYETDIGYKDVSAKVDAFYAGQ